MWVAAVALLCSGCDDEQPEDGSTTVATSVGMSAGGSTSAGAEADASTSGETEDGDESSTGTPLPAVSYADDVQPLWNVGCTCHLMGSSGTMTAPFLTLNPDVSYGELVGVASEQADLPRVTAGTLEESYVWLKMTDAHLEVGEGTVMPQGGILPEEQLDIVRAWILQGAEP